MAVQDEPQTQGDDDQLEDGAAESQPLLTSAGPAAAPLGQQGILQQAGDSGQPKPPTTAAKAEKQDAKPSQTNSDKTDLGQCRICLEEDAVANLEKPCGCSGTSAYAHKDCIQKWINEKHNKTCEVCEQQYGGSYTVPPPPPPQTGEQLQLVAPLGNLYLTVVDDDQQLLSDVYEDWDEQRQPAVSWCFNFFMFLLFMMFLHSSMTMPVPQDGSSGSGSSSPAMDPSSPTVPDSPADSPGGGAAAGFAAGASLLLLWLLTKLFLVVLPLLMVMRLAARAQEQAAEAAGAGTVPGLEGRAAGSSAAAGSRGGVSLTDLEMEVLQTRRAALSRLGRDPTFWSPAAAAGGAAGGAGSNTPAAAAAGQQQQPTTEAEQRMMAAVRAMVRAAIASAARRQLDRQQGRAAEGSSDGASTPTRLSGVV